MQELDVKETLNSQMTSHPRGYVNANEQKAPPYQNVDKDEQGYEVKDMPSASVELPTSSFATPAEIQGKRSRYTILPQITLADAKALQEQTGLVVAFASGQTTTSFIGGKGNFGQLRLGRDQKTGEFIGIKEIIGESKIAESLLEAEIQESLTGLPHLMPLMDSVMVKAENNQKIQGLYQVMPLAALGNGEELGRYLQKVDPAFRESVLVYIAKCLLTGFKHLHEQNVVHLDFRSANLVVSQKDVFVIDFGCAKKT